MWVWLKVHFLYQTDKKKDTLKNCESQYCTALNGRVMVNNKLCKIVIVASWSVVTSFAEVTKENHENPRIICRTYLTPVRHLLHRKKS
jgi:hypothetical protein